MEIMLLMLLASASMAMKAGFVLPSTGQEIRLERLPSSRGPKQATPLQVTDHVVSLKRKKAKSVSSGWVQAIMHQALAAEGDGSKFNKRQSSTSVISIESGSVFLAEVTVGGQSFDIVIDTGSSDPWLVTPDFVCANPETGAEQPQSDCAFGPPYRTSSSSTYAPVTNENMNITYADQERLNGPMGFDTFVMADITVPHQQFGLVDYAEWDGDGTSSGLIGFAYSTLTSAYSGTNPEADQPGGTILYNPLFVNMYNLSLIPPVFSLVLNRGDDGGVLALGGVPDVQYSPDVVSTPIISVGVFTGTMTPAYEFYTIESDGFAFSSSPSTQFNVYGTDNPFKTNIVSNGSVIIDSGTSIIYAPQDVAEGVAAAFRPPGTFNYALGFYMVECSATPPIFGVSIEQKIFYVNELDMIEQISESECISGVQSNNGGLTILGDVWMKNVVCVFDIGAEMMMFAAREFYDL